MNAMPLAPLSNSQKRNGVLIAFACVSRTRVVISTSGKTFVGCGKIIESVSVNKQHPLLSVGLTGRSATGTTAVSTAYTCHWQV
jgi:hypothetical protein